MGSRIRENPEWLFECFLEVVAPTSDNPDPWVIQKFPERFKEQDVLLKSVGQFAYPCQTHCTTVQHFSFVLTNIDSKWTYGFCRHAPNSPTCFCILSYLPWHETFFKLLDRIAEITHRREDCELGNFLEAAHNVDVPQPGSRFRIDYNDGKRFLDLYCPDHRRLPSLTENRNLSEYYSAIDVNNMLLIFASMLNERRILITSNRLSRVSACIQAASALLYPMHWQHIFIPVLPVQLSDYQSAPMPFLIGVPSPVFEKVRRSELGDVVLVRADENTVETPFDDLHSLPLDILTTLKRKLKNQENVKGDGIARAFLFALVQLIGGYRDALKFNGSESITFCREAFVQSRNNNMQPYLERMLHLQIFQQFIEDRLEMLNSGKGLNDIFEDEVSLYAGKGGAKFKMQYKEWMGNFKKESGALLRSMKSKTNPAVKHAYKHVRDKSRRAYKEVRSIFQDNQGKDEKYMNSFGETTEQPRSAPASPTLVRSATAHGTKLSRSTSSQRSVVSYVRPRDGPTRRTANGRIETVKNSVQYSPLTVGQSPTGANSFQDSSNGSLDADLDIPPVPLDLMDDLKDVIFTKLSLVDNPSTIENSSTGGSSLESGAPPINRSLKPQLSPEISTNSNFHTSQIFSQPLPPPRTKRHCTAYGKDLPPKNEEAPLIRLDSEESDVVFDPLLAKENDKDVFDSPSSKPSNLDHFQGPQTTFLPTSPPPGISNLNRMAAIPPPSPSMALNNPVYFHVLPATFQQSVPNTSTTTSINGSALLYLSNSVVHATPSSPPTLSPAAGIMPFSSPAARPASFPHAVGGSSAFSLSPSTVSGGLTIGTDPKSCSGGLASPRTLVNNSYSADKMSPTAPLPSPRHIPSATLSYSTSMHASNRVPMMALNDPQQSYLHGSYRRDTLPANLVSQRTKMFEDILQRYPLPPSPDGELQHATKPVPKQRKQWQTFE